MEKKKKRSEYNNTQSYDDELDIVYELLDDCRLAEKDILNQLEAYLERLVELIETRFPFYFPRGMINKAGYLRMAEDLLMHRGHSDISQLLDRMRADVTRLQSEKIMALMILDYETTAQKTAQSIGVPSVVRTPEIIRETVLKPWCEDRLTFLDRIKKNTEDMDSRLRQVILKGIRGGWSIKQMAEELRKVTGMAAYKAQRLIRTETMAVYSKVTKEIYLENGIEYIEIIGDAACGGICLDYVGEYLPLAEADVGIDLPPYHPNCACSFCSYMDFGDVRVEGEEIEE